MDQLFIIGWGWLSTVEVIEAPSLAVAKRIARERSIDDGVNEEALDDQSWAEPYSDERAYECGLIDQPTKHEIWRSQAPWR